MSVQKVVLITGCSDGGLGAALAVAFHKAGFRVIATARTPSKLSVVRGLGIEELQLDVLSEASRAGALTALKALTGGRLDMLVNNAGQGYSSPVVDSDLDKVRHIFELNVFSIITMTQTFLPLLLATAGAKIVNNLSVAAVAGLPFQSAYNASKAAANAYTENLRIELAPFDVQVVALMTGSVATRFFENATKHHGNTTNALPKDSIYRVVPDGIKILNDPEEVMHKDAEDAEVWAKNVVSDLSTRQPPYQIWRGKSAGAIRVMCHLPIGVLDNVVESTTGLDELDKMLKRRR